MCVIRGDNILRYRLYCIFLLIYVIGVDHILCHHFTDIWDCNIAEVLSSTFKAVSHEHPSEITMGMRMKPSYGNRMGVEWE